MKKHRNHALTLLVALLITGTSVATAGEPVPAGAEARTLQPADFWTAVSASGTVESRTPGATGIEWSRLRRGDLLNPLSVVRTDNRGRTTLTRRGDIIIVSPDTEVTLPQGDLTSDSIHQDTGKALYKVEPGKTGRRFEVVTPFLVAGVKGTQFSVQVEEGFVAVDVVEGHVEVLSLMSGERLDLFEGHMVMMERDGRFELFRDDRQDRMEEKTVPHAREIRKETKSMAREAVASLEISNFMNQLKDMLSDSRASHADNDRMTKTQVQAMAEKLGVDVDKVRELLEERKTQRIDDTLTGLVKILGGKNSGSGN